MTVAVVPMLTKTAAPAVSSGTASDNETSPGSALDFAALLLGQLAVDTGTSDTTLATDTDADTTDRITEDGSLFAALGLAPAMILPPADGKEKRDEETTRGSRLAAGVEVDLAQSTSAIKTGAQSLDAQEGGKGDTNLSQEAFTVDTGSVPDDKAARFAVGDFSLPKDEPWISKSHAIDAAAGNSSPLLAPGAPSNHRMQTPAEASFNIGTSVRDPSWAGDFSQKIVWLASNDKQTAQLTLNPPQMGPIEITLNINKDNASAFFVSGNSEVREAIETALPRLREMLSGAGIELGQAHVGSESFQQQAQNSGERQAPPNRWQSDNAILGNDPTGALNGQGHAVRSGNSLVDTFA